MTPEQIAAYIQAGSMLVTFGKTSVETVREMFAPNVKSESELNTICAAVADDASRRKALADADAGGTPNG